MTVAPDWAQVLGTAAVLLLAAAVAWADLALVEAEVVYERNGTEADVVAAIRGSVTHRLANGVVTAVGFPLAWLAGFMTEDPSVRFAAFLANAVGLAALLRGGRAAPPDDPDP